MMVWAKQFDRNGSSDKNRLNILDALGARRRKDSLKLRERATAPHDLRSSQNYSL